MNQLLRLFINIIVERKFVKIFSAHNDQRRIINRAKRESSWDNCTILQFLMLGSFMIRIKKGLDLPILGDPEQAIYDAPKVSQVALLGSDYLGLKPSLLVQVGDAVKKGQPLMSCKKQDVLYTSPGGGKVVAINRGEKRVLQSIVIELNRSQSEEEVQFKKISSDQILKVHSEEVKEILHSSGAWAAIRTRPFNHNPQPKSSAQAVFINAMDSNPHAPSAQLIIQQNTEAFLDGLKIATHLTTGKVFVCYRAGENIPMMTHERIHYESFSGPHPSGLVGTHIHHLFPVSKNKTVWHFAFQDCIAFGKLFTTGKLFTERVISLAGPGVLKPRMIKTRLGAQVSALVQTDMKKGNFRVINGSVLHGEQVHANSPFDYLGRYQQQVAVIAEAEKREFLGWMSLGLNKFSTKNIFLSYLNKNKKFAFDSSTNGSPRALVPIGMFEKVLPFQTNATFLLRSLLTKDTDLATQLGVLELDEEDLGLCTFVCPGKTDYGKLLRENLKLIEREG
jgi:Na+-transporting NADH:ubiquinone oxidoreductase subunit A